LTLGQVLIDLQNFYNYIYTSKLNPHLQWVWTSIVPISTSYYNLNSTSSSTIYDNPSWKPSKITLRIQNTYISLQAL